MKGKNFLRLTRSLLLIVAIILISACHTCPESVFITYPRPAVPSVPDLVWIDVPQIYLDSATDSEYDILYDYFFGLPGYYGLNDRTAEFDDLQGFFDEYGGYLTKIDNVLKLYETPPE